MKPQEFRSKIVNCVSKWRIPFAVSLDLCAVGKGQNWPSLYNDILTGAVVIKQIDGVCDIIYILLQRIKVGPYERNILVNVIFLMFSTLPGTTLTHQETTKNLVKQFLY